MIEALIAEFQMLLVGAGIIAFFLKLIMLAILVFAVIGLITTIRFFRNRKKAKKTDPAKVWMKTGKMPKK